MSALHKNIGRKIRLTANRFKNYFHTTTIQRIAADNSYEVVVCNKQNGVKSIVYVLDGEFEFVEEDNKKEYNHKYQQVFERVKDVLTTAKKLGLKITPGGGYTMGYSISNLPPHSVGLIGALSIVLGENSRSKLGLNFAETMSLEAGFNGTLPNKKYQRYTELEDIGYELSQFILTKPRKTKGFGDPPPAPNNMFEAEAQLDTLAGRDVQRADNGDGYLRDVLINDDDTDDDDDLADDFT